MRVIASHNGTTATQRAFELLSQGTPLLDAIVSGVSLVEDDPEELSVGYGGLPNEDGVVELDAAVMDGPSHRGAAVAGLRDVRHPTRVAHLLMQQTKRVLLVGEGALRFALTNGFERENLLTDRARRMWLYWKRKRSIYEDWVPPSESDLDAASLEWFNTHYYGSHAHTKVGTVHVAGIDAKGDMACATSTSGHAFKMAGRVGDSPILGAGLYVDNAIGSCGSIGFGEANLENLSSFAVVERLRAGDAPVEAGLNVLRRVAEHAHPWQRDAAGDPKFNLWLFVQAKDGRYAGVTMRGEKTFAVSDEKGTRLEPCVPLIPR